ncbi:hypothetical protein HPB52_014787 [Rhipicephalus sanguineus]|uniref:Cystatin domain-containing protein n=1 Tax=Rhipicephalus sanguineus TaxID=34632 RepID=A0A9D4QBI7_RHISA|nr:hypothetical protein HPB52_014787 [Rhipicephalus sanguineus]
MAAIKPTCMIMLLGVWLGVLLDSGYADSSLTGAWQEQNPHGDPQYLILAHYAVSKQTKGKKMYDTVVRLIRVSTQVVNGFNYKIKFVAAQSNCKIGRDQYDAWKCPPVKPANKECEAVINVAPTTNARKVVRYSCLLIVFPGDNFNALSAAYM